MVKECNQCWGGGKYVHPEDENRFNERFEDELDKAPSGDIAFRRALGKFRTITCPACNGTGENN